MAELRQNALDRSFYLRLSVGASIVGGVALLRMALIHFFGVELPPLITFCPVVMIVALIAGLWAGLLATVLAVFSANYWLFDPRGHYNVSHSSGLLALSLFFVMGVFVSVVAERYRRNSLQIADYQRQQELWRVQEKLRQNQEHIVSLEDTQRKTEKGLRTIEARLQAVIASAMDAVVSVDEQQRIVVFNRAAEAVFQCPAAEALGSSIDRFIPDRFRQVHREHIRRFGQERATGRSMSSPGILTALRSNGEEFPIEATISQVEEEGERLYTVILRDITERKKAEEALRQSEAQFHTLADAIPQLCWMARADGSIFWYNVRWYEYTGTIPELMQGWGWQAVHDPATLPNVLEQWKRSLSTGEPFDMVFPLRGADGVFRPFLTRVMPLRDEEGKIVRWFGTNTDISEQKQIEQELRKSNTQLDLAVEVASLGEWEIDLKQGTGFRSSRHAQIFGYPPDQHDWSFQRFLDHLLPQNRDEVQSKIKNARNSTGNWDFETQIRRVDGEVRWVWVRGRLLLDEQGEPARALGIVVDITDRKLAEQALLRSEKLASVGRMAASIAHQINNPLEATTNALFIAMTAKDLPPVAREFLEMADAELKRIAHITRQSLGFYRESNAPALVSVNSILDSAVDLLKIKISKKRATIEKQWQDTVEIIAIAGELRQVFSNLVANSLDAMPEGGKVLLRVSVCRSVRSDGRRWVRITIADTGAGIPASARTHLFKPFYTTKGTVGTGLGLWVSKQIIDKHDGSMRVRSCTEGPSTGTVFSILLPAEPVALSSRSTTGVS